MEKILGKSDIFQNNSKISQMIIQGKLIKKKIMQYLKIMGMNIVICFI